MHRYIEECGKKIRYHVNGYMHPVWPVKIGLVVCCVCCIACWGAAAEQRLQLGIERLPHYRAVFAGKNRFRRNRLSRTARQGSAGDGALFSGARTPGQ